jgi:hypothetical protein
MGSLCVDVGVVIMYTLLISQYGNTNNDMGYVTISLQQNQLMNI